MIINFMKFLLNEEKKIVMLSQFFPKNLIFFGSYIIDIVTNKIKKKLISIVYCANNNI